MPQVEDGQQGDHQQVEDYHPVEDNHVDVPEGDGMDLGEGSLLVQESEGSGGGQGTAIF